MKKPTPYKYSPEDQWKTIDFTRIDLLHNPEEINAMVIPMMVELFQWDRKVTTHLDTLATPDGKCYVRNRDGTTNTDWNGDSFTYNPAERIGHAWYLVRAFHAEGIGISVHPYSLMREGFRVSVYVGCGVEYGYFCADDAPEGIAKAALWAGQTLWKRLKDDTDEEDG